jgi:BirA family biotin operon repressor/biotin-[acetyl-CoA-carboxylase] ligase
MSPLAWSVPLYEPLRESLPVLRGVLSRATPVSMLLPSCALLVSPALCRALSRSRLSAVVAAAPPMQAKQMAQPMSQCLTRMAIELPDPQAKIPIVSETPVRCQCYGTPGIRGDRRGSQAGLNCGNANTVMPITYPMRNSQDDSCRRWPLMQPAQLLSALAAGEPVSGAGLAAQTGITRAAIWKQIEVLRARGVPIEAQGAAGYRLPWPLQMLDAEKIRAAMPAPLAQQLGAFEVHWELDSTSSELQRRGATAADFSILLAETQTAGRGRRGRPWLSPPGLNLYLSCLKRFDHGFAALGGLSLAIGVIVMRTLKTLGVAGAGLKWPNDLLAADGKLGGILVELSGEYQGPCAAIIGIGLNLRLTPALREQAGQPASDMAALTNDSPPDRNRVAATLISALIEGLHQFERDGFAGFANEYALHDLLKDQPLQLSGALGLFDGIGAGVDDRGALQVRMSDGSVRQVDSAEVTVRRA